MAKITIDVDTDKVRDEYHSMSELYNHRCHLFVALMRSNPGISWRSLVHHDGTMYPEWFIAGMDLPTGRITYHLPKWMWSMLDGYGIADMPRAPEWDGHKPEDVIKRLAEWRVYKNRRSLTINRPWQTLPDAVASGVIREDLYTILPLYGVTTNFMGIILKRNDFVEICDDEQPHKPIGMLAVDKEIISLDTTVGGVAMDFKHILAERHPGKWTQFAGQVFADSVAGAVRLIYGIKE